MERKFFNTQHSPIGAFASFTLGYPGAKGGLGLELGKPADQNIYVGVETAKKNQFQLLPFYQGTEDERARFETVLNETTAPSGNTLNPFADSEILRTMKLGSDEWRAGDMRFILYSFVRSIPDPQTTPATELKKILIPAVFAELVLDNSEHDVPRRVLFGYQGSDPYTAMRRIDPTLHPDLTGVGQGRHTLIAASAKTTSSFLAFSPGELLPEYHGEYRFDIGNHGALVGRVAPREKKTFQFVICFYRGGFITANLDAGYLYANYFSNIEEVARFGLENFGMYKEWALASDRMLEDSQLSQEQKNMSALAIRSYYASTELLYCEGKPLWNVNEGEYRMINTLDVAVDLHFFEMRMNPWTVRNMLDRYAEVYQYEDLVQFPRDTRQFPGGISFTHDMGVANSVAQKGFSVYERLGTNGCFSFMTHEQLANWVCAGLVYYFKTADAAWMQKNENVFTRCLESLVNRDHPEPSQRNGVMGLDSSRTHGGAEITTFDCHETSLRQARNNLYLAVKTWAAYFLLRELFKRRMLTDLADLANTQAHRCAATLLKNLRDDGYIPAILPEKGEAANLAGIIPAIEGLIFPYYCGFGRCLESQGEFGFLSQTLKRHLTTILKSGWCLFEDGGWKLSSDHDNSWPSKIYLCQFVARKILGFSDDLGMKKADQTHLGWLLNRENAYWCWSDQMVKGVAKGARYYPRGVTAILWLEENE